MFEVIKKTLLAGIGMGLMTRDKVEELAREIAKSADLSAEKGQAFVDEAVARARKSRTELEATVQRILTDTLRKADVPTRDDLARLSARIEQLEQRLPERPG
ncbi:MAG: phasin family protein [Planctomycetota bacterium]